MRDCESALCAFVSLCLLMTLESGCRSTNEPSGERIGPEPGVPLTLATARAQAIEGLSYDLKFTIPADPAQPIDGHAVIRFSNEGHHRAHRLGFQSRRRCLESCHCRRASVAL